MEAGEYEDPSSTALGTGELDRTEQPRGRDRRLGEAAALAQRGAAAGARQLHHPPQAAQAAALAGSTSSTRARSSTGTPRASPSPRCSPRAPTSGSPARTPSAAPSRIAIWPCTTRRPACATCRSRTSPERWRRSSSTTARSRRPACLGFEYGYSAASPESLMLWEAQFGDFANSAQVIIDSFIVAGESKWGQTTRLTLLLPHGYEGAGPEHSSARIERFIQLGSEGNIRLANPTTAAQYFHLLRRQARIAKPRPLVVFTPEGPAAAPRRGVDARGADHGPVPVRARRPAGRRRPRGDRAPGPLQRQALLRHRPARAARVGRARWRSPGSSSCTRSRATRSSA